MINKNFDRSDFIFSLCGLNCGLCPSFVRGNCPGCRAGSHCSLVCEFAPCSVEHGNIEYCFECDEYPCPKYDGVDEYDSLISHKNQLKDIEKAKMMGVEKYRQEQIRKKQILNHFLKEYDNGHMDVFFCLACNLLEINDLYNILKKADDLTKEMDLNKKSDFLKELLNDCASKRNIELILRKGRW